MSSTISFEINGENSLTVYIETTRLNLKSVALDYYASYSKLVNNSQSMEKYKYGHCWSENELHSCFDSWIACWKENDPFSSLAVFKKETNEFIGHITLEKDIKPGYADLGYVFDSKYWGKGYAKEAVTSVVYDYSPELVKRNYTISGKTFSTLTATARLDNPASIKILESIGMEPKYKKNKFGTMRQFFSRNVQPSTIQKDLDEANSVFFTAYSK